MPVIAVGVFIWSFLSVKPQGVFKKTTGHFPVVFLVTKPNI